jgi:tRNA dimethylallyltransferase
MDALIRGNSFAPYPSTGRRQELEALAREQGIEAVIAQLQQVDPESAARLHPSDQKRIIRAMEVYLETGQTITEHNRRTQQLPPRYTPVWFALEDEDRQALYNRIDRRVEMMLEMGLLDEIRGLLDAGVPEKATSMQAIGYKEFLCAMNGCMSIAEAAEAVKKASRHYAKRQLTWFRRNENMNWIKRRPEQTSEEIFALARQLVKDNDN